MSETKNPIKALFLSLVPSCIEVGEEGENKTAAFPIGRENFSMRVAQ